MLWQCHLMRGRNDTGITMLTWQLTRLKIGLKILYGEVLTSSSMICVLVGQICLVEKLIASQAFWWLYFYFSCSELNDTVAEAQLRTRQVPPGLPSQTAIQQYMRSKNRLLILVTLFLLSNNHTWPVVEQFFIMLAEHYNSEMVNLYLGASTP
jgi:hypothetical protein